MPTSHEWLPKFGSTATRQYGAMPLIGLCPVVSTPRASCVLVDKGRYPPNSTESRSAGAVMERVRETIRALQPVDEGQKWLQNQALEENILLLRQRWLLIEGGGPSVRPAYIGILVFWVMLIFASFGFSAPRNATVVIGFLCCSLAIGSAIFLILELDARLEGYCGSRAGPWRLFWLICCRRGHKIPSVAKRLVCTSWQCATGGTPSG